MFGRATNRTGPTRALLACGISLLALSVAGGASAQIARDESVLRRAEPGYKSPGVQVGGFIVQPRVEIESEYDDNVFRTKKDRKDDVVFRIRPGIMVSTDDWFPVNISIGAFGEIGRHVQYNSDDYEAFGTNARISYDLAEDWSAEAGGGVTRSLQRRGLDTDNTSDKASLVWIYEAGAALRYQGDPFAFRFAPLYRRYDFVDSGNVNHDDRDRQDYLLDFRFAYKVGANTSVFIDPSYIWLRYDDRVDDSGFNRDSQGYDVRVGVGYDASELLYFEAGVGYFHRNYRDSNLGSEGGVSALARFFWNPTETLSVEGELTRGISESDASTSGGSSKGSVATGAKLRLGWSAADNILVDAGIGWFNFDYNSVSRTDNFYTFDAGARYYINEYLFTGLRYSYERRDSNVNSLDYRDNRVMLSIGGQL